MPSLRSCEELRREHRLIGDVVAGLEALVQRGHGGGEVPALPVSAAVDFFASFVARCHETKESEALFPALVGWGAANGLVAAIGAQHAEGDRLLAALRPLVSRNRIGAEACRVLDAYLALLRTHIAQEDAELLPLAERVLSAADDQAIEGKFAAIEERVLGHAGSEALIALAAAVTDASRALAAAPRTMKGDVRARDVMRPRPRAIAPDDSLARAAALMESIGVREVGVVADGKLVGILARTDLEPHRGHYEWTSVRAAMTPDPVCVGPDMPASEVARLIVRRGFNAVPVTEHGELRGMITRTDVLRALTDRG